IENPGQFHIADEVGGEEVLANEKDGHGRLVDGLQDLSPPVIAGLDLVVDPPDRDAALFQLLEVHAGPVEPFGIGVAITDEDASSASRHRASTFVLTWLLVRPIFTQPKTSGYFISHPAQGARIGVSDASSSD